MNFSIRQYTFFSILLIATLAIAFSYRINASFIETQNEIELSRQSAATQELKHALQITLENINQSARYLSQWQEVRQQLDNPEIFAYWYSVRFKQHAFDLQKYTEDLMIYDNSGKALSKLDNVNLEYKISVENISTISYFIENDTQLLYYIPIYDSAKNLNTLGFLNVRLNFLSLLKTMGHFQHIELQTLEFKQPLPNQLLTGIRPELFTFKLIKSGSIQILETLLKESIVELIIIIAVPSVLLLIFVIFLIGNPIRSITSYINDLRKTGSSDVLPYNQNLQIKEINEIYHSISQYHKELSEKEENLSLTLNSIGDAVITTDSRYRIVRMNPVAERLTGWSHSNAVNRKLKEVFNLIDPDDKQPVALDYKAITKLAYSRQSLNEVTLVSKNGNEFSISESAAPIVTPDGDTVGLVIVFNDITEKKIKDEQLQQSQKMDALGKLTGGIAHDFNNMIGIILGYSEILQFKTEKSSAEYDYIKQIHFAADRARQLTSKLLAFSSKSIHTKSVCDVNELIESEQHMLSKTLTARIKLKLNLEKELWPVELEPGSFQDALLNICINAMHAMPDGGSLSIDTRNIHLQEADQFQTDLIPGDYILISVTDTGIGMDKQTRLRIFDPFFTTKGEKGTGLGMSQVYGFVKQSSGTINIYSEQGYGTKVTIYIPRAYTAAQKELDKDQDALKDYKGNETVLVVDDEAALTNLCCNILSQAGYNTVPATSAKMALEVLQKQPVDLLLSDVIMPEMDGFELSAIVAKQYPQIKIQLVSGFTGDHSSRGSTLETNILSKPFSANELLSKVRQALDL